MKVSFILSLFLFFGMPLTRLMFHCHHLLDFSSYHYHRLHSSKVSMASSAGEFSSIISNTMTQVTVPYLAHYDPTSSSSSSFTSPGPIFMNEVRKASWLWERKFMRG